MHHRHIRLGATLCLVFLSETLGYRWPSPQYDALEGLLYEGRRADGLNIADIMHPCLKRPGIGSLVAAEWLRIVSTSPLLRLRYTRFQTTHDFCPRLSMIWPHIILKMEPVASMLQSSMSCIGQRLVVYASNHRVG